MIQRLEHLIEVVKTWPESRQADAAAMLEMMAANDGGVYKLTVEERRDITTSQAQAQGRDFATDAEVAAVLHKHGL